MQKLIRFDELQDGRPQRVQLKSQDILICRVENAVYAVNERCPHEDISLSLGVLCEYRLRCPLHGSEFDIRSGQVLNEPAEENLDTYPVRVDDGWVCIDQSSAETD